MSGTGKRSHEERERERESSQSSSSAAKYPISIPIPIPIPIPLPLPHEDPPPPPPPPPPPSILVAGPSPPSASASATATATATATTTVSSAVTTAYTVQCYPCVHDMDGPRLPKIPRTDGDRRSPFYRDIPPPPPPPPNDDSVFPFPKDTTNDLTHLSWKDSSKEHYRGGGGGKTATATATVDPWISRSTDERDHVHVEPQEAVGENRFMDDKFKDKDRKRKDAKQHRDEREKDRTTSKTPTTTTTTIKEDRERDAERDRKDSSKDRLKEKEKEKEKEKREPCNDIDTRDDGDMSEKKESDDASADKQVYNNYGLQHRKRMQRSRGSPHSHSHSHSQVIHRLRTHNHDIEGSQGKAAEVSSVIYKVGECMLELVKLWKDYESESSNTGPTFEIRIPAEHVTATNRQVRGGQLWGTDIYTDDSDLVAVLMHTGYCRPTASPPPPAILELRATIRVLPPQDCYISTLRNNVRSRAWGAAIGCSYRIERCCIVKKSGGTIDLEPCLTHTSTVEPTLAPVAVERTMTTRAAASNALRQQRFVREVTIQYNLCNEPWIKYSISIVADKGLKKPLYTCARLKKGEVLYLETHSCRYELCFTGEKMVKAIQSSNNAQEAEADKLGSKNQHAHVANESDNIAVDVFRWARCRKPLPQKVMRSVGIPLPVEHVEVLEENLDWEDVQWSQTGVWISGKEYTLARVHFLSNN